MACAGRCRGGVRGACWGARCAPPCMRSRAQAAPLHRACQWCGWAGAVGVRVARWRGHSAPPLVRLTHGRRSGWAHQVGPVAVEVVQWLRSSRPGRVGVGTQGNRSDRLRQPVGPAGHGVDACAARWAWWAWCMPGRSLGTTLHAKRSRAQAAPLHRPCGWCGWRRCGRCRGCRWRGHSAPLLARWIAQARPGWAHQVGQVAGEVVGSLTSSRPAGLGSAPGATVRIA
jgi:hypothetical protein